MYRHILFLQEILIVGWYV